MHFKLDENVPVGLVYSIRMQGFEASGVYAQGLSGVNDRILAKHCKRKRYVLITLDNDFSHLVVYPANDYEGIIVLRPNSQGLFSVVRLFQVFLKKFDIRKVKNKTVIVEETSIRIRY